MVGRYIGVQLRHRYKGSSTLLPPNERALDQLNSEAAQRGPRMQTQPSRSTYVVAPPTPLLLRRHANVQTALRETPENHGLGTDLAWQYDGTAQ